MNSQNQDQNPEPPPDTSWITFQHGLTLRKEDDPPLKNQVDISELLDE